MTLLDRLFRRSPFGPIIEHAKMVYECIALIDPMIQAWLSGNTAETERLLGEISRKENAADELKIQIRNNMPKSLFYPVPRGDLLRILNHQDNMADAAQDLGVILTFRKTQLPELLTGEFLAFVNQVIKTCQMLLLANEELNNLMEVSFTGPETEKILALIDEIGKMEYQSDSMSRSLVKNLLRMEHQLDTLTIIFIMKIIEVLGELANHAENCGDNLRHLILSRT